MNGFVLKILFLMFLFGFSLNIAYAETDEPVHDYLYSEEYFDYLIECAMNEKHEQEEQKQSEEISLEYSNEDSITLFNLNDEKKELPVFKLGIEENFNIGAYSETFKKENSKTIIPVGDKFSFIQDTTKFRNKYNSNDYRVLAGIEVKPFKYFNVASGVETNYRNIDQNPTSRKLYFTPTLYINDKLSLSFFNKFNVLTHSSDHDVSINLSPFKSKAVDFRLYTGVTKYEAGNHSESVNFYTNFYFF